jgi:hypothetical protein
VDGSELARAFFTFAAALVGAAMCSACRIVGQPRGTQRYTTIVRADEDALTQAIIALASQYGRYGYRRIKSLLDEAGWDVGCDRVQRIWRREGLKVPQTPALAISHHAKPDRTVLARGKC